MRFLRLIPAALVLVLSAPAFAADWIEYENRGEFFRINMPGEPKVEEFVYTSTTSADSAPQTNGTPVND